jgi:ubiquinone/menaquinone biosynthesis C-methylase UbiE
MSAEADYAAIAPRFDQRYKVVDYRGVEKALFEFVEPAAKVDVLEVGCGTGHWLRFLDRESGRRVGIDPSPEMLSRARVSASGSQLARASAEALPLADKSFDRLFCINAFHHFRDKTRFLSEAHRVLRPGGRCLIVGLEAVPWPQPALSIARLSPRSECQGICP